MCSSRLADVTITTDGREVRRRVGPTAWVVLEELSAHTGAGSSHATAVDLRLSDLTEALGLSAEVVRSAMRRLIAAGIVEREQPRSPGSHRFVRRATASSARPASSLCRTGGFQTGRTRIRVFRMRRSGSGPEATPGSVASDTSRRWGPPTSRPVAGPASALTRQRLRPPRQCQFNTRRTSEGSNEQRSLS